MGMIIFLTAAIVETALAAFCIITKSNQVKVKSIIRVASFVVFVLLAVLPVIDWGLRYYALASLLLMLSIIGAKALAQEKAEKRDFNATRVVFKAIGI